jgi:hypothetical protein
MNLKVKVMGGFMMNNINREIQNMDFISQINQTASCTILEMQNWQKKIDIRNFESIVAPKMQTVQSAHNHDQIQYVSVHPFIEMQESNFVKKSINVPTQNGEMQNLKLQSQFHILANHKLTHNEKHRN